MRAVIIDLDGTIIDTTKIQSARDSRRWKECVARADETCLFEPINDVLDQLRKGGVKIAVVTSSVSYYAGALIKHHQIPFDKLVAYHDAARPKPSPEPIRVALERLDVASADTIGIGDRDEDAKAYLAADVIAYGAGWNPLCETEASWDSVLSTPEDLLGLML